MEKMSFLSKIVWKGVWKGGETNVDWTNVDWTNVDWTAVDKNIWPNVGRGD